MKLNWFSPLPPARTGIAEYTRQVLPALRARAEVVLWTDQADWDRDLGLPGEVRRFDPARPPWDEFDRADLNIYQMGNSPFHESIWHVSRRCPGLVVLHDLNLTDFCRHALPAAEAFAGAMSHCYGEAAGVMAEPLRTGRLPGWVARHFPMTEVGVGDALGVVVHTRKTARALSRHDVPVTRLQLPYPATEWPAKGASRPSPPGDPYQLIIFGHLGSNRGVDKVLTALAALPWRDRFRLSLYGEVAVRDLVEGLIRDLGLGSLVRLHGHVSDEVLDAALGWSDLAINLRYPTMGEASHSQLRIWDHALPSVVTKVGWYAELPPDAVVSVRPGEEVQELQRQLLTLLRDPESFRRIGECGRRCLEQRHSPEGYVEGLLGFAAEVREGGVQAARRRVAAGVAGAAEGWAKEAMSEWLREGADGAFADMTRGSARRREDESVNAGH